ncbi:unnamed protein product [Caretta caretta]
MNPQTQEFWSCSHSSTWVDGLILQVTKPCGSNRRKLMSMNHSCEKGAVLRAMGSGILSLPQNRRQRAQAESYGLVPYLSPGLEVPLLVANWNGGTCEMDTTG